MTDKKVTFGGFNNFQNNNGSPRKEKDFLPRDLPRPIDTRPAPSWSIESKKKKETSANINSNIVVVVNLILPIIGLTILIGGIVAVSYFVFNIYNG